MSANRRLGAMLRQTTLFMVEKISAVTLRVANMEASVRFYKDVLGLEIVYGGERSYFTSLRTKDGDTILNLEHDNASIQWGAVNFFTFLMLTVSGHTSWKRAFIQTPHTMPRGANVIFICPILMAMSFHLLVRSSVKSRASEIPRRADLL